MKRILLIIFLIGGIGLSGAQAQYFDFGLSIDGGFPQGNFKNNVESNGVGIEILASYSVPRLPVSFGFDMGFINYGNAGRKEIFSPNIPEVRVEVKTTNNIFTGHFFTRLEVKEGIFRPYADGLVGFNYLWTESRIEDDDEYETIASTTNFEDTAFSYGVGGGIKFRVARSVGQMKQGFIDLRVRYLFGGEAEYLKEGALRNVNGTLVYDTSYSSTDLLTVGVGFTVQL